VLEISKPRWHKPAGLFVWKRNNLNTENQLVGIKDALIFAGMAGVVFLWLNLFLNRKGRREKFREWRASNSTPAKIFRHAILILILLTLAHLVVSLLSLVFGK